MHASRTGQGEIDSGPLLSRVAQYSPAAACCPRQASSLVAAAGHPARPAQALKKRIRATFIKAEAL